MPVAPLAPLPDVYARAAPSAQAAVDLFAGEWSTILPEVDVHAGAIGLYADPRIELFIDRSGGVHGRDVIELGPLEASHTYMLERAGARVTAIEANSHAFLRCLVVKELVPLTRSRFLYGDFLPFLESTDMRPHLVVASGVLYHAPDPIRVLRAIARVADHIGIWTHHYDPATMHGVDAHDRLFDPPVEHVVDGRRYQLHRRHYREALELAGFCGGTERSAVWMELADIVGLLEDLRYEVEVATNDLHHPHGAAVLLHARRG